MWQIQSSCCFIYRNQYIKHSFPLMEVPLIISLSIFFFFLAETETLCEKYYTFSDHRVTNCALF